MNTDWLQSDVQVGGSTIHYARTGGEGKPVIVLAHGFSDSGMCWLPVAQALSDDYDVILPDAVGHGHSSRVQPGQELDLPGDLAGFIQALKLSRPVVGGHSMGASTTATMAARFPQLARALILEDPVWRDEPVEDLMKPPAPGEPNPWLEFLKSAREQPTEAVMAYGRTQNPLWPEGEMRPWAESKQQFDPNFIAARQESWWVDLRSGAKAITVPTLLITAEPEKGSIVTAKIAEEAEDLNPQIQVVQIHNSGHNIRRENPPAYFAAIRAFLAEL
jgi:pimeloyl-ACP methyl ester carboxylesterase